MKKLTICGLLIGALLTPNSNYAQSTISVDSIYLSIFTEYLYEDSIVDMNGVPLLKQQLLKAIIQISGESVLKETQALEISLGTSEGISDLLFYEFSIDNITNLPSDLAYYRDGNFIHLILSRDLNKFRKYCKLRIKDINGQYSLPIYR